MTPDFTLIWPLSCLKDGVHLFDHRSAPQGVVAGGPDSAMRTFEEIQHLGGYVLLCTARRTLPRGAQRIGLSPSPNLSARIPGSPTMEEIRCVLNPPFCVRGAVLARPGTSSRAFRFAWRGWPLIHPKGAERTKLCSSHNRFSSGGRHLSPRGRAWGGGTVPGVSSSPPQDSRRAVLPPKRATRPAPEKSGCSRRAAVEGQVELQAVWQKLDAALTLPVAVAEGPEHGGGVRAQGHGIGRVLRVSATSGLMISLGG